MNSNALNSIDRRSYMKLVGVISAAGVGLQHAESVQAETIEDGYGLGGYGANGYGITSPERVLAVSTDEATDVTDTTATLNGSLTELGSTDTVDVGFEYRHVDSNSWDTTGAESLTETESFSIPVTDLESGKEYEFRAVAIGAERETGSTATFETRSSTQPPVVEQFTATLETNRCRLISLSRRGLRMRRNPRAEVAVSWEVSSADGRLETVELVLADDEGDRIDEKSVDVDGDSVGGSDTFELNHRDGDTYECTIVVTDTEAQTASETTIVSN